LVSLTPTFWWTQSGVVRARLVPISAGEGLGCWLSATFVNTDWHFSSNRYCNICPVRTKQTKDTKTAQIGVASRRQKFIDVLAAYADGSPLTYSPNELCRRFASVNCKTRGEVVEDNKETTPRIYSGPDRLELQGEARNLSRKGCAK